MTKYSYSLSKKMLLPIIVCMAVSAVALVGAESMFCTGSACSVAGSTWISDSNLPGAPLRDTTVAIAQEMDFLEIGTERIRPVTAEKLGADNRHGHVMVLCALTNGCDEAGLIDG